MKKNILIVVISCIFLFCCSCANNKNTEIDEENSIDINSAILNEEDEKKTNNNNNETSLNIKEETVKKENIKKEDFKEEIIEESFVEETVMKKPQNYEIKITFTGDCMLASYMNQTTSGSFNEYSNNNDPSYFFEKVKHIFESDDITVVNLENVFTDQNLKEVTKNHNPAYWYRSQTSNVNILTTSSIEAVSIANNHSSDYGYEGYKDTLKTIENANLLCGDNDKTFYFEKNGYKIAFICHGLWGEWQADAIITRIKEAESQSDFQIIYYHGGTERIHTPEQWKINASRKLVDNGADLVIGNHPHVLQPMENYNNVDIIYSMGNFCFGGSRRPENRTIIYQTTLTVTNDGILESKNSTIIPCYAYTGEVNNYQPAIIENETEKQNVIDFMNWKKDSPF